MLIRKLYLVVFIILLSGILFGAEIKPVEKSSKVDISLNGGLTMKFSDLGKNNGFADKDTSFAYLLGFKAEAVFNKSWYLGGATYFLGNDIDYLHDSSNRDESPNCIEKGSCSISLGYGGLIAGYIFNIKHFFRIETGVLIGGGRFSGISGHEYSYKEPFFALEPEANLLFVISRFMAVSVSFSYRLLTGMKSDSDYSTADLSGPSAGLDIRFGSF
ncbi:MAG TPA: hypothetical protein PKG52_02530 [bacterium]|nr:hypothetical protein [bacterium]HPS30744.1 hypothetical protein [bacterium]